MQRRGEVVSREGGRVFIRTDRPADCHRCGLCAGAGDELVAVEDSALAVGTPVELSLDGGDYVRLTLLLYLLPAVVFVAGLAGGAYLAGEAWGLVGGLAGLAAAALGVRRWAACRKPRISVRPCPGAPGSAIDGEEA